MLKVNPFIDAKTAINILKIMNFTAISVKFPFSLMVSTIWPTRRGSSTDPRDDRAREKFAKKNIPLSFQVYWKRRVKVLVGFFAFFFYSFLSCCNNEDLVTLSSALVLSLSSVSTEDYLFISFFSSIYSYAGYCCLFLLIICWAQKKICLY